MLRILNVQQAMLIKAKIGKPISLSASMTFSSKAGFPLEDPVRISKLRVYEWLQGA
ncbi:MAG: hypothetical protein ACXQTB_00185 [Candidatus Nezhaarchaeales archaeon]